MAGGGGGGGATKKNRPGLCAAYVRHAGDATQSNGTTTRRQPARAFNPRSTRPDPHTRPVFTPAQAQSARGKGSQGREKEGLSVALTSLVCMHAPETAKHTHARTSQRQANRVHNVHHARTRYSRQANDQTSKQSTVSQSKESTSKASTSKASKKKQGQIRSTRHARAYTTAVHPSIHSFIRLFLPTCLLSPVLAC